MYNKISILGGPGSGKSTLCNILSKELNIPAIHLDSINFSSNWIELDKTKRDMIILSKQKEKLWIIDGNYTSTMKDRFEKADLIIWLDYSTLSLLKGIFKRFFKTYKKERPEIPGCIEKLDFTFIKYVATYNKKKRHIIVNNLKNVSENKILIFKKQKYLNKWIKEFKHNKSH